jgi:transcriptional regulator with PAS, ATPase and Fis domain
VSGRPAQTTIPSREVTSGEAASKTLAIRWGFPDRRGACSVLTEERMLLGRDEACAIHLPGEETSRRHAEIRRQGEGFALRDLDSRNGIFVDGARIRESSLSRGQVLRLGEWIGIVTEVARDIPEAEPVYDRLAESLAGGPVLRPIVEQAKLFSRRTMPMILLGETGTGKEGFARAVHDWSGRTGPFIPVNCAALAPSLAEAELFGYRKGAFTGAERASQGVFRAAQGGTLLLDEIADLPEALQAKLLRALELHEVLPLGESVPVKVDVRILAATQIPLGELVAEKRFRSDLHARLDGFTVILPPLRERKEEVPFLFQYLWQKHAEGRVLKMDVRLVEALCLYDWPLNVREMNHLVQRLVVSHGDEPLLRRSFLPEPMLRHTQGRSNTRSVDPSPTPNTPEDHQMRRERELTALREALRAHKGSMSRAAAAVGISRYRAYRLVKAAGLMAEVSDDREEEAG